MAGGEIIVNNLPTNTSPTVDDKVMVIRNADGELTNVTLDDIGDLIADPPEVVWVTYGLTSQADIEAAYQAKKIVMMQSGGMDYLLASRISATNHKFVAVSESSISTKICNNGSWSSNTSSIPSASSSNPEDLGVASPGVQNIYSRADHVHKMPNAGDIAYDSTSTYSSGTVGKGLSDLKSQIENLDGISPALKTALLQIAEKVAYIDDQGQTYYQALYDALYPGTTYSVTNTLTGCATSNISANVSENDSYSATITPNAGYSLTGATVSITMGGNDITSTAYNAGTISIATVTGNIVISVSAVAVTLSSISAVYTQSGTVYTTDSLDSLKTDLVVTATWSDSSTTTVPSTDYTLSGTLTAGTSTVTVTYGGKTTTFNVTVSQMYVTDGLVMWLDGEFNGTNKSHETTLTTWIDQTGNGWDWTNGSDQYAAVANEKSVGFNGNGKYLYRDYQSLPNNVKMVEVVLKGTAGGIIIAGFGRDKIGNTNIATTSDNMTFHTATGTGTSTNTAFHIGANSAMDNIIHSVNSAGYLDGVAVETSGNTSDWQYEYPSIGRYRGSGGTGNQYAFNGEIYCIRLYSRILTEAEILANYATDVNRFGIGA